jgi:hypothetical protein
VRRAVAYVLNIGVLIFIGLLVWSHFPNDLKFLAELSRITGIFELGQSESPIASLDFSLTMLLAAGVATSLSLNTLARILARVWSAVMTFVLEERFATPDVEESPPRWKWWAGPISMYLISVASLRIFPEA